MQTGILVQFNIEKGGGREMYCSWEKCPKDFVTDCSSCLGILNIRNLWVLLRENVVYLTIKKYNDYYYFSLVTVDEVAGSDVKLGTLLERNSVGNGEIYDFLIISCIPTITKGILASKNMLNRCVVYAFSTHTYFAVTSS